MRKGFFGKKFKLFLLSLCFTMVLIGCKDKDKVEKEVDSKVTDQEEVGVNQQEVGTDQEEDTSNEAESDNVKVTEAPTEEASKNSLDEEIVKEADLDENGVTDILKVTQNVEENYSTIQVNLNGNQIFEYKTNDIRIVEVDQFEYVDLDQDGNKEIFITSAMNANTRPLTEVLVMKEDKGAWRQLSLPINENGHSGFLFDIKQGEKEFDFVISSEYLKEDIHFDASQFYRDDEAGGIDTIQDYRKSSYIEGDKVGHISAWGLHGAKIGTYEDKTCIVGVHGIEAIYGHFIGYLYIYFNFDETGAVKVLNVEYQPERVD